MRVFVAVPVPGEVQSALAELQAHLAGLPALDDFRWIPVQNLHLTLRFLGEVEEKRIPDVEAALRAAASGARALELPLERFGVF
ncbi:MAG: RNA 2',3'-cyclic phosphodiesterase, partial [bacterium]|nr:RNA 2',3'-cyclic phosphodiesterase [bacterium]